MVVIWSSAARVLHDVSAFELIETWRVHACDVQQHVLVISHHE